MLIIANTRQGSRTSIGGGIAVLPNSLSGILVVSPFQGQKSPENSLTPSAMGMVKISCNGPLTQMTKKAFLDRNNKTQYDF